MIGDFCLPGINTLKRKIWDTRRNMQSYRSFFKIDLIGSFEANARNITQKRDPSSNNAACKSEGEKIDCDHYDDDNNVVIIIIK